MTAADSVTYDRAAFWRRTAIDAQDRCAQYLERIEAQDNQLRRMQDLILELNAEAQELQASYENRGRRIADLEEEYATAMGQVSSSASPANQHLLDHIEMLDLSLRTYNCLKREGIHTVADLVKMSQADLIDIRNFGAKSLNEVEEKLAALDLELAPNPPGFQPAYFGIGGIAAGALGAGYAGLAKRQDLSIQK